MASRVALPSNLTGATLGASGEGVSLANPPSLPAPSLPGVSLPAAQPVSQPTLPLPASFMAPPATLPPPAISSQPLALGSLPLPQTEPRQPSLAPSRTVLAQENKTELSADAKEAKLGYKFNPLNIVWLILIFLAVFMILYTTKINLVTDLVNGERVLNNNKLIFWAVLISLIIAVLGYVIVRMWNGRSSKP